MPEPTRRIVLVRHGRTVLNAQDRLRGLADPELDDTGIAQAHATATALQPLGLARVLSSPLQRAARTATIIAETSGIRHVVDPAFNDRDYGPWTGHLKAEVIDQWGSINDAPDVESEAVVLTRALRALNALARTVDVAPVAIVTHDAVIRPILATIDPGITPDVVPGSWAVLTHTNDGWSIDSVDNLP